MAKERETGNDLRRRRLSRVRKRKLSERSDDREGKERPSREAGSPRAERRKGKQALKRRQFAGRRDGSRQPFAERFQNIRDRVQGDRPESPGDGTILDAIRERVKARQAQGDFQRQPGQGDGERFAGDGSRLQDFQQGQPQQIRPEAQPAPAPRTREEWLAQQAAQQPGAADPRLGQPQRADQLPPAGVPGDMGIQQPAVAPQPVPTNLDQVNAYDAQPIYAQPPAPVAPAPDPRLQPAPVQPAPGVVAPGPAKPMQPAPRRRILPDGRIIEE